MKTKELLTLSLSAVLMFGCTKEKDELINVHDPELGSAKSCPQQTVHYTALAFTSWIPGHIGFATGQLKTVWEQCNNKPPHNLLPTCGTGPAAMQTSYCFTANDVCTILQEQGTNCFSYPNITYAEQQKIIQWAVAKANLVRPNCPTGGKMSLWTLGFLRDTNIPDGFCFTAKYYCCPR